MDDEVEAVRRQLGEQALRRTGRSCPSCGRSDRRRGARSGRSPGRSKAIAGPSIAVRNGSQSAEWVGLPWTKIVGGPSPGRSRTNVRIPSISMNRSSIGARHAAEPILALMRATDARKPLICLGEGLVDLIGPMPGSAGAVRRDGPRGPLRRSARQRRRRGPPGRRAGRAGERVRQAIAGAGSSIGRLREEGIDLRFYAELEGAPTAVRVRLPRSRRGADLRDPRRGDRRRRSPRWPAARGRSSTAAAAIAFGSNTLVAERSRDDHGGDLRPRPRVWRAAAVRPEPAPRSLGRPRRGPRRLPPLRRATSTSSSATPARRAGCSTIRALDGRGRGRGAARARPGPGRRHRRHRPRGRPRRLHAVGARRRRSRSSARSAPAMRSWARSPPGCMRPGSTSAARRTHCTAAVGGGAPGPAPTSGPSSDERRRRAGLRPRRGTSRAAIAATSTSTGARDSRSRRAGGGPRAGGSGRSATGCGSSTDRGATTRTAIRSTSSS